MKVWILETFTAHTVIDHTANRMNLILNQIVPDYQYECLLRFDKYTVIAGHDIHIIIPSWWKSFDFRENRGPSDTKIPKNDTTITRKKDDATVK